MVKKPAVKETAASEEIVVTEAAPLFAVDVVNGNGLFFKRLYGFAADVAAAKAKALAKAVELGAVKPFAQSAAQIDGIDF